VKIVAIVARQQMINAHKLARNASLLAMPA
jgi:hypothetical protein